MTADSTQLRRSPLYERQRALGARFVPFAGWELPVQYSGVKQEHAAVREAAGLFDVTHMGELRVRGAGAADALDRLVTNDVARLAPGRALYTVACNERGGILDDLIVYRLPDESFLVVCNGANRAKMSRHFERELAGRADFADESDAYALLALQGPRALAIVEQLDGDACARLPRFGVLSAHLAGVPTTVARTGYTGEDGFELFCATADAVPLWDALMSAGSGAGLTPAGLGARDTLRLEARLLLYGNDIDEAHDPYEAGLGWTVKLGKSGDFVGRAALAQIKREGPSRKLVGFAMRGRGIARAGYPIVDAAGDAVGTVTSGAPALSLGENIGLGYVPRTLARTGTRFGIEIRGKVIEAEVVPTPFYKPNGAAERSGKASGVSHDTNRES